MEQRKGKMLVSKSGGTAGSGGVTFRATLPSKWVREMGLSEDNRQLKLAFDGERIIIEKSNDAD